MSEYTYYPRRTDDVVAIPFGGPESVRRIFGYLGNPEVKVVLNKNTPQVLHVLGHEVPDGHVVVIDPHTRSIVEVLDPWDFAGKYSKDGL